MEDLARRVADVEHDLDARILCVHRESQHFEVEVLPAQQNGRVVAHHEFRRRHAREDMPGLAALPLPQRPFKIAQHQVFAFIAGVDRRVFVLVEEVRDKKRVRIRRVAAREPAAPRLRELHLATPRLEVVEVGEERLALVDLLREIGHDLPDHAKRHAETRAVAGDAVPVRQHLPQEFLEARVLACVVAALLRHLHGQAVHVEQIDHPAELGVQRVEYLLPLRGLELERIVDHHHRMSARPVNHGVVPEVLAKRPQHLLHGSDHRVLVQVQARGSLISGTRTSTPYLAHRSIACRHTCSSVPSWCR